MNDAPVRNVGKRIILWTASIGSYRRHAHRQPIGVKQLSTIEPHVPVITFP